MTDEERCRKAVERGIKRLDEHNPHWFVMIDLDELYMRGCYGCILGQIFGWFGRGINALDLPNGKSYEFGFDSGGPKDYPILQRLWTAEVLRRRQQAADKPSPPTFDITV